MLPTLIAVGLAAVFAAAPAAKPAPAAVELTRLLETFLAGASTNDAAIHERFWADDLIYTGSAGRRIGKADILSEMRAAPAPTPDDPKVTYGAEDIRIQQYDDAAMLAFRLVATTVHGDTTRVANYLNTGWFVRRKGEWRVVGWQATRMP